MTEKKAGVRVRFAPSPTGYLHVGGLRTALYNYLFAKKNGGDFILRIEDTDRTRYVEGAVESLVKSLEWAGLEWSEGAYGKSRIPSLKSRKIIDSSAYPEIAEAGEYGPYIQSERLDIYKKHAEQLVADGEAYRCFCGSERLEKMRAEQTVQKKAPMYDRHCTDLSKEEVENNLKEGRPHVIRLKVPREEIVAFEDMVRGKVSFNADTIDDQVLLKSDGFPTYHLASVVDDHLMGTTHVIRGEEWLPSTPKHILLYRAFGWEVPVFAHIPLLLNPDKSKLSKRQGDVAVEDYIEKGYLKEALVNFVALLGWNPGEGSTQEIFSMEELIEKFDLSHVHKAGAVFDLKKLDWINGQYIKKLSVDELHEAALPFLEEKEFYASATESRKSKAYLEKVLTIEKERLLRLSDVGEENRFFFEDIAYDKSMLRWKEMDDANIGKSLEISRGIFEKFSGDAWELAAIEKALLEAAEEKFKTADGKIDRGALLWPLRVALTGAQKSPSPFEAAWVLGKDESLKRIAEAMAKL